MRDIYITHSCSRVCHTPSERQPRERFKQYYNDLHKLYKIDVDPKTFNVGGKYSYTELGSLVLDDLKEAQLLHDVDMVICALWAHEFDSDHSSSGPYFAYHYDIKGQVFDICDQGTLAPYTAFEIAQQYLQDDCEKVLVLTLEQTCIPRSYDKNIIMPVIDGAAGIILEAKLNPNRQTGYRLLLSKTIPGKIYFSETTSFQASLDALVSAFSITHKDISLVMKEGSSIWELFKKHAKGSCKLHSSYKLLGQDPGAIQLSLFLDERIKTNLKQSSDRFMVILDKDVESSDIGFMLIEETHNASI